MKLGRVLFVCFFVSLAALGSDYPPKRGQTEMVRFPQIGNIRVEGVVRPNHLPEAVFTDSSGKALLRIDLGSNFLDTKYIDPNNPQGDPNPIVRFKVIQPSGLPTPIVFAGVMHAGGSDCSYGGQFVGYVNGRLAAISEPLPMVNAEGGYSVGDLQRGMGLELATWNMIWGKGEAHVDPHDHWVRIYRFNASSGRFELVNKYIVPKSREVRFPNILLLIPDFGC